MLNLSSNDINYNIRQIFTHVSHSDPKYLKKLQEYFIDVKDKYTKFSLMTHFTTKNMEVDSKKLTVIAHGTLTVIYGEHGFESIPRSYKLTYEWVAGHLRIKEFLKITDKDARGGSSSGDNSDMRDSSDIAKDATATLTDFIKAVEKEKSK